MTVRGNEWPIDPTSTSGTELATVLNRMVDALDSTNHTDNTGDRPDYAVKGTMWLDGDVSAQNLGLKMYTGLADALLFDINDQTGAVTHTWRQVDLHDPTLDFVAHETFAAINQKGNITEFIAPDEFGVAGVRAMSTSLFGLNVDGKLNLGYSETTNVNALSVQPRVNGGVQFYVTDAAGAAIPNILLAPGKLSGGESNTPNSIFVYYYGLSSRIALVDGSSTNAETGVYVGNPTGSYWAAIGNDGGGANGANRYALMINRQASNSDFQSMTIAGAMAMRVSKTGQVYGTGPYVDLSDGSTKTVSDSLGIDTEAAVMALAVRKFKRDGADSFEFGYVADEVQGIIPTAVKSFAGEDYKENATKARENFLRMAHGEATPSGMHDIAALDAPDLLGLDKDQINAVLLDHVQNLTRRIQALENK